MEGVIESEAGNPLWGKVKGRGARVNSQGVGWAETAEHHDGDADVPIAAWLASFMQTAKHRILDITPAGTHTFNSLPKPDRSLPKASELHLIIRDPVLALRQPTTVSVWPCLRFSRYPSSRGNMRSGRPRFDPKSFVVGFRALPSQCLRVRVTST